MGKRKGPSGRSERRLERKERQTDKQRDKQRERGKRLDVYLEKLIKYFASTS